MDDDEDMIDWSNISMAARVLCIPSRTDGPNGFPHDPYDEQFHRHYWLDPRYSGQAEA